MRWWYYVQAVPPQEWGTYIAIGAGVLFLVVLAIRAFTKPKITKAPKPGSNLDNLTEDEKKALRKNLDASVL